MNQEEMRNIFLAEWAALETDRKREGGVDYREEYLEKLDEEFEKELTAYLETTKDRMEFPPLTKIKKTVKYGVWNFVCKKKNDTEGEPREEIAKFFDSGELGSQIIDNMLQHVFTLIGSVWGPFTALVSSQIGKAVVKWVNGRIASVCDKILTDKSAAYCKVLVQKPE